MASLLAASHSSRLHEGPAMQTLSSVRHSVQPLRLDNNGPWPPNADNFTSFPLHTDPEMYALRSSLAMPPRSASAIAPPKAATMATPTPMPMSATVASGPGLPSVSGKRMSPVNSRLAYVEALVDTNALVIESMWCANTPPYPGAAVVPLRTFIQEVLKRSRTTYSTLQTALFYLFRSRPIIMDKLSRRRAADSFTRPCASPCDHEHRFEDAYISCGRRMFLASLVVASKFVQDKTYRNSAWAKIAGLPVAEINAAERVFLELIDYQLFIAQPTFDQWHHLLHMHVEAKTKNQPTTLHDLSRLPFATHSQSPHPQYQQGWTVVLSPSLFLPPTPYECQTPTTPSRKRRLDFADDRRHSSAYAALSPPLTCSPGSIRSTHNSSCSPANADTHAGPPPMLSLSLPSTIASSPLHTPTQISPVRMSNGGSAFMWKLVSPNHADIQQTHPYSRIHMPEPSPKKRKFHDGYAVSHIRQTRARH